MIDSLKPYPEMKDSGAPWLGNVPQHWAVVPNRALFAEVKDREHPDEQMLSVTITRGVIQQKALLADSSKKDSSNLDRSAYKLVKPGDIAYNKMRAWQGAIGVSDYRGIVSPAYVVMRLRNDANPRYFHYLYRTAQFAKEAERWSYGITSDMWSLRPEDFRMIYSILPPREEQDSIVRFLDYADRRIRSYIRAKQKLIGLLEEQKQAIIHLAVTRGLDPAVRLKPSTIEWLGEVPQLWTVAPLKRFAMRWCDGPFGSGLKSAHYTDEGVQVIRLQNIGFACFHGKKKAYISREHYETLGDHSVQADDLLVAGLGEGRIPAGRACVAPSDIAAAMVKADCFRFRLKKDRLLSSFAAYQLSATATAASAILSTGATRQRINLSSAAQRAVAVPPVSEQQAILSSLASAIRPFDSEAERAQRGIKLIREFRTSLVADVVTGKFDVREVQTPLMADEQESAPEAESQESTDQESRTGLDDMVEEETEA